MKVVDLTDAGKRRFTRDEILRLGRSVDRVIAARGKSSVMIDIRRASPSDDDLIKLMMGPTGNLRAPTVLKGRTLLVGFNEDAYERNLETQNANAGKVKRPKPSGK